MNCKDCLLLLDEYVESELDEKSAAQVSAHLDNCAACAGEYEMLRRELRAYSQFLPGIEAMPALWTNVLMSVEEARRKRFSLKNPSQWIAGTFGKRAFNLALAAVPLALLVTFGIIIGLTKYKSTENTFNGKIVSQKTDVQLSPGKADGDDENGKSSVDKNRGIGKPEDKITFVKTGNHVKKDVSSFALSKPKNQFASAKTINTNRNRTTDEIVEKAERQYKNAIAILSGDIKRRRAQLAPNLISQLDESLAEIDRTIIETRRAVRAQPDDALMVQYLTTAYAKKVELLRTIASN